MRSAVRWMTTSTVRATGIDGGIESTRGGWGSSFGNSVQTIAKAAGEQRGIQFKFSGDPSSADAMIGLACGTGASTNEEAYELIYTASSCFFAIYQTYPDLSTLRIRQPGSPYTTIVSGFVPDWASDTYQIQVRSDGFVEWARNGIVFLTSDAPVPSYPVKVYAAFGGTGTIAPVQWIAHARTPWVLLLSTDHSSTTLGEFSSGAIVGALERAEYEDYRIGLSGAELQDHMLAEIKVTTATGSYSSEIGAVTDASGFDNTCTTCNCGGNAVGDGLYWHGGRGGCYGGSHFGFSTSDSYGSVHTSCKTDAALASVLIDAHWGHFHRRQVDTGVYVFGRQCINEVEYRER